MQSAKSPPHVEPGMHRKSQPLFQGLSILSKPPSSQQDAGWVGCPSCMGEAEIATKFNKLMLSINCPWKESTIRRKRYWKNKQTNKQKTKSTTNLLVFSQGFTSSKKRCVAFSEPRPQLDQETKVTLCNGGTPLPCLLKVMPPAPGHLSAVFWEKPVPDVQTETGAAEKRWSGWRATSSPFQLGRASLEKMAEFLMDWSVVCWKYASTD